MRKGTYQNLIDALAGISASEGAKRQFAELIRQSAARDGIALLDRSERVKFARCLLDQKEPRATINKRLMARYGIRESQAYRDISDALQTVPKPS